MFGVRWSDETQAGETFKKQVELFYQKGLDLVRGGKLCGYEVNLNNPKEVIACLYLLAEDFNMFHEKF